MSTNIDAKDLDDFFSSLNRMPDKAVDQPRIPFLEELSELGGKTIIQAWTDWSAPRILLVFTDRTAAIITEDTSACYYNGDHGEMMVNEDALEDERAKALEIWNLFNRETMAAVAAAAGDGAKVVGVPAMPILIALEVPGKLPLAVIEDIRKQWEQIFEGKECPKLLVLENGVTIKAIYDAETARVVAEAARQEGKS